jgi:tRNA/tmRNA/rRNA uracil-C5-methylase (TrmA/RlmC/RlmD family)
MPAGKSIESPGPIQPIEPIVLTMTGMAPGGEAVGRHEGLVVFVTGALPGETVRAAVTERRSTWARARLLDVLEAAPERTAPRCRHFGVCGGCDWQQIEDSAQVAFKTGIVREQLARLARLPHAEVRPCLPSPSSYGYRNSTRLAATADGRPGYRLRGSHTVFAVEECPILEPVLQGELEEVKQMTLEPGDEVSLRVPAPIRVGAFEYRVGSDSFFQVNTAMAGRLVDETLAALSPRAGDRVLDLYAGVGLFTLPLAAAVGPGGRVLAVEAAASAVADGRLNSAGLPQVGWLEASVEQAVRSGEVHTGRWSHVLLDPPRRGVEKEALATIAGLRAPVLVYVSCDPATLARDTLLLRERGYRLTWAQPLDLFPQTAHIETVARFALAGG